MPGRGIVDADAVQACARELPARAARAGIQRGPNPSVPMRFRNGRAEAPWL